MRALIDKLNEWTKAYDEGHPIVSDEEWDKYYFQLQEIERTTGTRYPDSPTQSITYQVVNKLNKVTHNHPMLSLAKTKEISEVEDWGNGEHLVAMSKLDGLTCSLTYKEGKLVAAETRGNGTVGEDILHNALMVSTIPNYINMYGNDTIVIDGEIICNEYDFVEFSKEYKNPRNFAAGSIRLLDSCECEKRKLSFVAWDIVKGFDDISKLSYKLNLLKQIGFLIPVYVCLFSEGDIRANGRTAIDNAIELIKRKSYEYGYPIDGVVFKIDDCAAYQKLGATEHHFRGGLAFKFYDEEYETTLQNIEWTMGRTGVLTPVAIFDPIDIDGTTVSRASLHNVSVMEDLWKDIWHSGLTLYVYKANQIIPQISKVILKEMSCAKRLDPPRKCPLCDAETAIETSDSGVKTLVCTNDLCEGKLINRLDHFCGKKGLDIKGLSKATLEKLIDWGWLDSISDIFELHIHKAEWVQKQGFGEKSVQNLLDAIEISKTCSLEVYISALGIPLIGNAVAKEISKKVEGSWETFIELIQNHFDFCSWDGFGDAKCENLLSFDYSEAKELIKNKHIHIKLAEVTIETATASCKDITFCVTGKLSHFKNRDAIKAYIEERGGKVTGSVSKNTKYLINNDTNSTSAKNIAARDLGIPIISEEEFLKIF